MRFERDITCPIFGCGHFSHRCNRIGNVFFVQIQLSQLDAHGIATLDAHRSEHDLSGAVDSSAGLSDESHNVLPNHRTQEHFSYSARVSPRISAIRPSDRQGLWMSVRLHEHSARIVRILCNRRT
jgi:hypothetical protein